MATTTWRNPKGQPDGKRYVKHECDGSFTWIETGYVGRHPWRVDLAAGEVAQKELPDDVAYAAIAARKLGSWPFWVEWPLEQA